MSGPEQVATSAGNMSHYATSGPQDNAWRTFVLTLRATQLTPSALSYIPASTAVRFFAPIHEAHGVGLQFARGILYSPTTGTSTSTERYWIYYN